MTAQTERYRLLLLGAGGIGKRAFAHRFCSPNSGLLSDGANDFRGEMSRRTLTIDGKPVIVEVDMAALDTTPTMLDFHIRGAHGIVLMYNPSSDTSFRPLFRTIRALERRPDSPPLMSLIGFQKDYLAPREISAEVGQVLARQNQLSFVEATSHNAQHIERIFAELVRQLQNRRTASAEDPAETRPRISTSSNRSHLRRPGTGFFASLRRRLGLGRRLQEPEAPRGVLRKRGPSDDFEEPSAKRVDLKLDLDLGEKLDANGVYENTVRRYR